MKTLSICLFLGIISSTSSMGQNFVGKIVDEQQKSVEFANVVVLSLPDSAFVQGTISDQTGSFILTPNGKPNVIRISSVGYSTVYVACSTGNMGTIQLNSDTQLLGEVVIKGDLPRTRIKGDAMITGVAGTLLEKSGTAENLLDKIPGVSANEGGVKVFGRGTPEIYINGRKVRDNSELDQLSADNIKAVEVINNPGARYAASVKAVIRIFTKKALGDGFGFSNRAYASYNKKWTVLDQFNFNYRSGGFDLLGMLYARDGHAWTKKQTVQDTYLDKYWQQKAYVDEEEHFQNVNTMLALNYTFNENHALGIRYNMSRTPQYTTFGDMPTDLLQDNVLSEQTFSKYWGCMQKTQHRANFYYNGQIGEWGIDFNADGFWSNQNQDDYTDEISKEVMTGITDTRFVSTFNEVGNSLYAGKIIFSRSLLGGAFSFGGEYSHTNRKNDYRNPQGILSDDLNEIKEGSIAAFAEYGRAFGDVNVQAGLRYENVAFDYSENDIHKDEQSKNYSNVFPSVAVSFPIGDVQMQLSYAADITRPSYHQLRGNIVYNDRYTYESGNPLLKPTLSQNITLGASYKWVQLSAGYQNIKDAIVFTCDAYSESDPTIALIKMVNAPTFDNLFASLTLSPTIGFWSPQFSAQIVKQWYMTDSPEGRISLNNPMAELSWSNDLQLPKGFLLNVDASWYSRGYSENQHRVKEAWMANIMLYKDFMKKRLSLQFRANDIFNTMRTDVDLYCGALRTMGMYSKPNMRSVSLTVNYKFNSTKSKYKGTGAGESQKNRM